MYPMHLTLDGAERELMFGNEPQRLPVRTEPDPMPSDHLDESFQPPADQLPTDLSDGARKVYGLLRPQPQLLDSIAAQAEMSAAEILNVITELEIYGCITVHPGSRYSLI